MCDINIKSWENALALKKDIKDRQLIVKTPMTYAHLIYMFDGQALFFPCYEN